MQRARLKPSLIITWLALVAMFALACGPSISRLLPQDSTARMMALAFCGGDGAHALNLMRRAAQSSSATPAGLRVDAGTLADDDEGSVGRSLCPMCAVHAIHLPGSPPPVMLPGARIAEGPPLRFYTSTRPLFVWAAVRSRGPPTQA